MSNSLSESLTLIKRAFWKCALSFPRSHRLEILAYIDNEISKLANGYPFHELLKRKDGKFEPIVINGIEVSIKADFMAYSSPKTVALRPEEYESLEVQVIVPTKYLAPYIPQSMIRHIEPDGGIERTYTLFAYLPAELVNDLISIIRANGAAIREDMELAQALPPLTSKAKKHQKSKHPYPRLPVFRKNEDYGQGFTRMLDEYRDGTIKGVRDFIEKKRKEPSPIKDLYTKRKKEASSACKEELDYWSEADADSVAGKKAIDDFLNYIDELMCASEGNDENK